MGLAMALLTLLSMFTVTARAFTCNGSSGNHADRVGIGPRIVSVSVSAGGMLIFAMMLGLVSDAISEKVDSLRKGKSEVIESNHILILGWSDKLGSLLKQLAIANKSLGGGVVVVLAERDKEEMEMDTGI
ncbi:putative ion channel POLLUX [Camellia lanceoleosa]|uniref:Ion channel POLLUX n=1 Tax=Camellia lanceoleosa TaxID=1840588 RepID=A0ACC0FTG4_9ERIC|nr:putative ion channel POLLUX [Camellia lanceoleosa]